MAKKSLYLANDYGFSLQQKRSVLPELVEKLESVGIDVFEPFERNNQVDRTQPGWAYRVGQADLRGVRDTDGVFAVVNGCPPDEGVMIEIGLAIAWNKAVFLFRDDYRDCVTCEDYPMNLMIFAGLPQHTWQDYWYSSVDEIADPDKALVKWIENEH